MAPVDSSMPMARRRRCASTVKPPTETSAMRSIPSTRAASEMVSGLSGFDWAIEAGVSTCVPALIEPGGTPGASNSATTWVGVFTCPGATSANSSRRLCGFSTMPTTRRSAPPTDQVSPTFRWNAEATPLVTATSPAPTG
ncbi:MAG: hypothetical protein ACLP36_07470 [Acidimicrobiales bacterium]